MTDLEELVKRLALYFPINATCEADRQQQLAARMDWYRNEIAAYTAAKGITIEYEEGR